MCALSTAGDHTLRVSFDECIKECLRDRTSQGAHGGYIYPVGDNQLGECISKDTTGHLDRDRTYTGDLTALTCAYYSVT